MDQERWRCPERNQVRQRVKLAPKRTFYSAHPRHPSIKQVKDAGQQDEAQGDRNLLIKIYLINIGFDDFGQGDKSTKEVPGRQQIRQKVDL